MMAFVFGYYQQAFTLLRMVAEHRIIALDIVTFPQTLHALMEGKGELGKGNLTYSSMAKRVSDEFAKHWKTYYGKLSTYGAHPRFNSISTLARFDPSENAAMLYPTASYDPDWADDILTVAKIELRGMLETIAEAVHTAMASRIELGELELQWTKEKVKSLMDAIGPNPPATSETGW